MFLLLLLLLPLLLLLLPLVFFYYFAATSVVHFLATVAASVALIDFGFVALVVDVVFAGCWRSVSNVF